MDRKITMIMLLFIFQLNSCKNYKVDCDECSSKPEYIELKILFNTNYKHPYVIFYLYQGNIEDCNLIYNDTTNLRNYSIYVKRSKKYSIKAIYL